MRDPQLRLPTIIEKAEPCEIKFAGVKLNLQLPVAIVESLEKINYPAILRAWGEGEVSRCDRWREIAKKALWKEFVWQPNIPQQFTFTLFLRDWENLTRRASQIGVSVEYFVTVALLHAAAERRAA